MTFNIGPGVSVDLSRLIDTRLLVQANSGGGKSWLLRRLLEQTHGHVQHLVIDPEGEFASLREKFDYVHAAKAGGDTAADARSAALLAERLLELKVSAILDIYELKPHERVLFVRRFLEALVDAPKALWHPALVVVDEAHVYCPQVGEAESAGAVKDLATRGRKRGFCALLATQRLSKLHKDAAAECNNKLIGRTSLDVDMKRAADELGFSARDDAAKMRSLKAGEFFAFGPAFNFPGIARVEVGPVETTHPKAGARLAFAAPPPTSKVKALLPKLADLPAEAEERVKSVEALKRDNAELRRELTRAQHAQPKADTKVVERFVLKDGQITRLEKLYERIFNEAERHREAMLQFWPQQSEEAKAMLGVLQLVVEGPAPVVPMPKPTLVKTVTPAPPPRVGPSARRRPVGQDVSPISPVGQRILDAIAELEQLGARQPERALVALLAGYTNINSKGFANALGTLSSAGLVSYPANGSIALTEAGAAQAEAPEAPRTSEDVQERICSLLGGASARILQPLIEKYPKPLPRSDVAASAGYSNVNSKGFANALGRLRSLGFVDYPQQGAVVATPVLFLESNHR